MTIENPFPGLRPFEASESHLFFGRETANDELLNKLRNNRFISVIGTSGSGKSSLVRAGMLPDLYGGYMTAAGSDWRIAVLRPGQAPIHALAAALLESGVFGSAGNDANMQLAINETVLRRGEKGLINVVRQARMQSGCNLLVVVDQFEELFRFMRSTDDSHPKEEAAAFVKLLLEASQQLELPIYVILTMRSEYLGDCTHFRDLAETINKGQYLIPRMTRDQKRQAITGPVAVGGASITPRLVQRLLNDVGDNPDQLPIMQHAMMRSWKFWEAENQLLEPLDLHHYEATGGMDEALSRHADEAFAELADNKSKHIAEIIFKRLTGKGADNRETRFPTTFAELCSITETEEEQVRKVIDVFRSEGRSFLMPAPPAELSSNTLIDISHESLIRIWHRLNHWVDEEAQSARIYRRLTETAQLYKQNAAGLWRDPDLQIALAWRKKNQPNPVWAKRYNPDFSSAISFINKSRNAAQRRKILLRTLVLMLLAIPISYYVYDLKKDLDVKETNILNLESSVAAKTELVQDALQSVSDSKRVIQQVKQELKNEAGQDNVTDQKIIGQFSGAVSQLQDTLTAIEQSNTESDTQTEIQASPVKATPEVQPSKSPLFEEKLSNNTFYLAAANDSAYISDPQNFDTCTNIVELNPTGCRKQFSLTQKVFFFCRIKGPRNETLKLVWYKGFKPYSERNIKMRANNIAGYRTFVWKRFTKKGNYQVVLYDQKGELIAARKFSIN